ncbi:MAG TPA: hypothetical protein VKB49_14830 [Candidatus Sulfotelmatobacter sp.]|nr:hypothetical protein [Candidatus Sulfotelmatobacter sp.]
MDATVEKREIIFKGIDGESVFRTTFHSMGAITVVLVEDISDGGRGSTMVPRPYEIARYLCQHFNVQAERLVLLWQHDLCWPAWIAWLLGYYVRRHYWVVTRMPKLEDEAFEMFTWEWKPCDWREASLLMDKPLEEPGVWITNQSCEMSRWAGKLKLCFGDFAEEVEIYRSTACQG